MRQAGYTVVSCDEITAELYKKRCIKKEIGKIFPSAGSGKYRIHIDKNEVARQAFDCIEKRKKLNEFLHPIIVRSAINRAKKGNKNVAFVEIPLLFETKSENLFDGVIVIMRDIRDRIDSVKKRSNLTEKEVLTRIAAQYDYSGKDFKDYTVIHNDKDIENFRKSVLDAIKIFH